MGWLQRLLALIGKEFAAVLRDPRSRFVVVGPPIIQFFMYGYAATFDLSHVRYAVLDEARTSESRALLARFEGSPSFELTRTLESTAQIPAVIDREDVRLVLHVGSDFSRRLHDGRPATLQVILDGRNSNVAAVASGYVAAIVRQYDAEFPPNGPAPVVIDRAWFNPNLLSRWYVVAALGGIISTVVVMVLTSLSVAREREFGTFDQLLVAPFRPTEILIGKAVPGMTFGLLDSLLLSAAAVLWFDLPFRGSVAVLVIALSLFIVSIVGVGLLVSSLSMTMQQALLGSFVFIMPAVVLSGFTTPIENMPGWLQVATHVDPLRYIVVALREIFLEGAGLRAVWPQLWPMAAIAAVTLPSAAWLFRHRAR
jgi:ABC-2 type transport system permease protein